MYMRYSRIWIVIGLASVLINVPRINTKSLFTGDWVVIFVRLLGVLDKSLIFRHLIDLVFRLTGEIIGSYLGTLLRAYRCELFRVKMLVNSQTKDASADYNQTLGTN